MKSIHARFKNIREKNPGVGDFVCFARAVSGQYFNKRSISLWMGKLLIEGHDYQKSDKRNLIEQLVYLSNRAEDKQKST